jgi:hypothetical protein
MSDMIQNGIKLYLLPLTLVFKKLSLAAGRWQY